MSPCCEGIANLKFEPNYDITAMVSEEHEEVNFTEVIRTSAANGAVEKWLLQVEQAMFDSIHSVTGAALKTYAAKARDDWVLDWPGMVVLVCTGVYWTKDVTDAISAGATKKYEAGFLCTSTRPPLNLLLLRVPAQALIIQISHGSISIEWLLTLARLVGEVHVGPDEDRGPGPRRADRQGLALLHVRAQLEQLQDAFMSCFGLYGAQRSSS